MARLQMPARSGRAGFDHLKPKGHFVKGHVVIPSHLLD